MEYSKKHASYMPYFYARLLVMASYRSAVCAVIAVLLVTLVAAQTNEFKDFKTKVENQLTPLDAELLGMIADFEADGTASVKALEEELNKRAVFFGSTFKELASEVCSRLLERAHALFYFVTVLSVYFKQYNLSCHTFTVVTSLIIHPTFRYLLLPYSSLDRLSTCSARLSLRPATSPKTPTMHVL